ncbi:MAG: cytochrome P450 [Stackebrandtia sp.]
MSQTPPTPVGLPLERVGPFDPPAELTKLRQARPISRMIFFPDQKQGWVVSSHELAKQILADVRFSSAAERIHSAVDIPGLKELRQAEVPAGAFIRMDPPEHTRLRRMLTGVFTVKRMKQLEPRIAEIVESHLDVMDAKAPPVDLVAEFALPVPSTVICELLGVPYEDRDEFQTDSKQLLKLGSSAAERNAAFDRVKDYILQLGKSKRANPTDDLLSDLAAREDLETEELGGMGFLLLVAGHETTANMLALGTFALLENPAQLSTLRENPSLIPGATEELMRYLSIIHIGPQRVASEDVEIGGELVKAGDPVIVSTPTVNRDPAKFDDPDSLDVTRHANGHLAFGHGVHQCLGQQLARIEMRIGYAGLLRRFPSLRLAVPAREVSLRTDMAIYGVHELPVAW